MDVSIMDVSTLDLSIVVPLYNEEESVDALHREITAAARGLGVEYEVLYVDDGSRDETPARLRALSDGDPRVRVIRFRRNYGQTAAMMAGIRYASGEIIIPMDGDLQNDPADFGLLLAEIAAGHDLVCGWRLNRQDDMLTRRLPSQLANWLIGRLTGMRIHDNGCTLKAYRRDVVKKASLYAEMHRFLAPMMSLSGCRYKEIVVNHRARRFGQSKYGISRIWKVFLDLLTVKMLLGFITRPAAWFGLLALPFAAASLAAALGAGYIYLIYLQRTPGSPYPIVFPSMAILFAVAAAHLLAVGMLAELVVKVGDFREKDAVLLSDGGGTPS
jgi:glycosyltransferase involved in cell wall biosynthesis